MSSRGWQRSGDTDWSLRNSHGRGLNDEGKAIREESVFQEDVLLLRRPGKGVGTRECLMED